MFDINGGEFLVLALLVGLLLGPDRLPELARSAARLIRRGRDFATGASAQMKTEMGVDLDTVDWRRYDPRQYHPKRIVQNALSDAFDDDEAGDSRPRTGSTVAGAATVAAASAGAGAGAGGSGDGAGPGAGAKPGAAASAAKRAEAARVPASNAASRAGAPSHGSARAASRTSPRRPSPPPTTWADAARRAGVDDDAT